jgi:NitT/TauT family transport system ATP-binding protein
MAKLEVRGISKSFLQGKTGVVPVLSDLSLDVGDLEFLAIIGPSGCGKSTFLRILDGLTPCDSGSIRLNGREVTGTGQGRGMVFQSFNLFPWRTALENVEFGLEVQGVSKAERRPISHHYIELVGLTGFEDAYPHQLSGGMQQRVGLARALAVRPEILLMDEPFGSLDVQTRDVLQDELLRIWEQEQKTVIFITHSIEEAIYLADRVVVFTPRPAQVERMIRVPFGRPRHEDLKTSGPFLDLRRQIWEILKKGVRI